MQTRDVDDELSLLSSLLRLGSGDNDAPDVAGLQDLEDALQHIRELAEQQKKDIYIRTFGRFCVLMRGKPVPLRGKAKEILALVVTRRGREISNEEIYSTLWEGRPYSNANMTVYYNALHRLRQALEKAGIQDLLVSGARGQMVDTTLFDCDYYDWMDGKPARGEGFQGEFLSEYSWGEYLYGTLTKGDGEA